MSRLPENYRGSGAFAEIADFQNRVARRLNNIIVRGNGRVDVQDGGIVFYIEDTDLSKVDYWYSVKGVNTLHVNGGIIPVLAGNIPVAAVDVNCPGTDTGTLYVYLEVSMTAWTASIVAVAVATEPKTELNIARKILYEVKKVGGAIVIEHIRIFDPWILPLYATNTPG